MTWRCCGSSFIYLYYRMLAIIIQYEMTNIWDTVSELIHLARMFQNALKTPVLVECSIEQRKASKLGNSEQNSHE